MAGKKSQKAVAKATEGSPGCVKPKRPKKTSRGKEVPGRPRPHSEFRMKMSRSSWNFVTAVPV
jgi:hypothetical protein